MKKIVTCLMFVIAASFMQTSQSAGLTSNLNSMFSNMTAPDVISNQFRGAVSGGGAYARFPIGSLQPIAISAPRFSAGCGGIDLYLGSFSYITADKLVQFIRQVAQNAAPLAFKMAIEAAFPQLSGVLDKFQSIAQQMNDLNKNSCQMAHGLVDAIKDPQGAFDSLTNAVDTQIANVKGWFSDSSAATEDISANPSGISTMAASQKNPDGTPINQLGNLTWNVILNKSSYAWALNIFDTETDSKQYVMALIGTRVIQPGASTSDQNKTTDYPVRAHLTDLFNPPTDSSSNYSIPTYVCDNTTDCLNPTTDVVKSSGIRGYVVKQMYGSDTATTPQSGSIVDLMQNCSAGDCNLSGAQKQFLNQFGRVPVVGLMKRAQSSSYAVDFVANSLMDVLVDEVSYSYGRQVVAITETVFSGSTSSRPDDYSATINGMRADLRVVEDRLRKSVDRINSISVYVDGVTRTHPGVMGYKPR